eukprot:CAMPEP_0184117736 /NCGR_PEP_ID=MMETSP0974-20121125/21085_1 /TAXON_ID=483370 /ORGANISM="non described non described, Strain CCMP2097" /LENGTH=165 /DNA_ID=CAMNT_0026420871 /DNA_START=21 /DNA_END=516 /DNA_ORIENTATION=-
MPRTLRLMGEAKVKRLASFGVHTVEELATVDVRDRIFAVSVTTNKRSDLAVKTLARWRDAAASYLRKRHGEAPEGDSRDVSAASRVIHADDVSIDALDDLEEAAAHPPSAEPAEARAPSRAGAKGANATESAACHGERRSPRLASAIFVCARPSVHSSTNPLPSH